VNGGLLHRSPAAPGILVSQPSELLRQAWIDASATNYHDAATLVRLRVGNDFEMKGLSNLIWNSLDPPYFFARSQPCGKKRKSA
jgi:hypothetical protein